MLPWRYLLPGFQMLCSSRKRILPWVFDSGWGLGVLSSHAYRLQYATLSLSLVEMAFKLAHWTMDVPRHPLKHLVLLILAFG